MMMSSMTRSVLCAIDDQEHSGWSADTAIYIARVTSSALVFFMVNTMILPGKGPAVYRWTEDEIESYFTEARRRARHAGLFDVACRTKAVIDIAKAILELAREIDASFIVVGSNSRPGLFQTWRASISREVASRSSCPTVIVRGTNTLVEMNSDSPTLRLAAVDRS